MAFLLLAVVSVWRDVPMFLAPLPRGSGLAGHMPLPVSAAVLPFAEHLVASPYAVGLAAGRADQRPEALRREADGSLVCELAAGSNRLGGLDGRALAGALASELGVSGVFSGVRFVSGPDELGDESVVIRGRVLDGVLRISRDGKRSYELVVELSAERSYGPERRVMEPFWRKRLKKSLKGGEMGAAYEVGELVRKTFGDVAEELGEAVRKQP